VSGPLAVPAFRRLWIAGFVSEIGDWVFQVAMPLYVYGLTGSVGATATTFVVALMPSLVLSPVAGVLADRWDRRRMMLVVSLVQAFALLPLLGAHDLVLINVVTATQAGLAALFEPAKNALLPSLVARSLLPAANGLIGLNSNLARLLGASLGGVLLAYSGLPGVLLADVVSFLVASLLLVRPFGDVSVRRTARLPAWPDLRRLPFIGLLVGLMSMAQGMFVVLFVVFVTERLGGDSAFTGVLRGVQAIGGLIGGVLVGLLARRFVAGRLLGWSLLVFGALTLIVWHSAFPLPFYVVAFVVLGVPGVVIGASLMSVLQLHTSDSTRGRVLGAFFSVFDGFQAVGMVLAGVLIVPFGLSALLDVQAGLYVFAGLLAVQHRWRHEDDQSGGHEERQDWVDVVQGHKSRR
jgi:MFS family permease